MFNELLQQDACRWIEPSKIMPASALNPRLLARLLYTYPALRATAWFRYGSWCKSLGIPGMAGFVQRMLLRRYGFEIVIGANVGGGLYVAHPVGTVLAPERMGRNCSVIAAVTVGMRNEWKFPRIGDEVFIGAGARVLGAIEVGDRAVIGANAVVIRDVPAGATVVGIPARIVGEPKAVTV